MAFIVKSNVTVSNLRVGPLSGGGNGGGGGGGSSTPSYLAVGTHAYSSNQGGVWVYDATNYSTSPTLLNPSATAGGTDDYFGWSVANTATQLVVGTPRYDIIPKYNIGAAYVYDLTNLSASPTILSPSGGAQSDQFGRGVAISSKYVVVGAGQDSTAGTYRGAAYVYDATNLSAAPTKIAPTDLTNNSYFGDSITIQGDNIIIAALEVNTGKGAVYVYDGTNLSATPTKLAPSDLDEYDNFGKSVAVTSNQIVVGARYDDDQGSNAGAAYVYDLNNLSATPTKLTPSGLGENDRFGYSVAATSNQIVVGSRYDDDQGDNAGAVYVYDATNLSATPTKLIPSGVVAGDEFGFSVAAYGDQITVGARGDDTTGTAQGAVYVYNATNLSASPTKLTTSGLANYNYWGQALSIG